MSAPLLLRAAWSYRGFVLGSVKREFESKYRNALLGAAWSVLNPVAMILVYTVIFAQVMQARLPGRDSFFAYSIYLCAGILSWGLFAEITGRAQTMFIEKANLIKKIAFPRICLPLIVVLNALLNFCIIFGLFIVFLLATGNFPGMVFWAIVPVLALLALFAIGLGLIVGVLNVFFRDIGQFFGIVLQFWFWLTPIVYTPDIVPVGVRELLAYNPLAAIIGACQTIVVHGAAPHWPSLAPAFALGLGMCWFGLRLFRKRAGDMLDEL
ncbi:ABC transporter permease [Massilia glaciei]|uniref:Transport permease protein n=1 Tax=Massilia glaciei TaxID=1524097 RepID=A0A2U2HNF6_9BURK|nr:ABC transporter permease [Massilia glaciei]PWF49009.1 ABC transporter permease [Massilia glaciei]